MYLLWLTLIFFNKMNRVSINSHFNYYWDKAGLRTSIPAYWLEYSKIEILKT